jgi:uncharacterized protein (DUF608 family)
MIRYPFNPHAPRHVWTDISADGFPAPVPGCIYDGARLDGGVPLGGLGTGYFTLEGSGKIGWCSIFNDIVPPRRVFRDWLAARVGDRTLPLSSASIAYWGHYPAADLVAQFTEAPVTLGIRAFSPFIPGDAADSNMPAALFEIEVTNSGTQAETIQLLITLPEAPERAGVSTALAGDAQAAFSLGAGESRRVRFVYSWHAPYWRDSGNEAHVHRYGQRWPDAGAVARDALARFDGLLARVLAWQNVIYSASDLPAWLRDGLIQSLYSLTKNTVWIAKTRKDEWWGADGWFTHNESHTGCPITETMVCRMHGHFPLLFFFPALEESTLAAFRHFQISDGEIPFSYGMNTSMRDPRYHCQHPLNSGQYAQMIWRLYQRTGDKNILTQFYDSAKRAVQYQFSLDDDGDGLVNDQAHVAPGELWPANQFYDIWPWWGTSAYVAGTWLATLACAIALADAMGDYDFLTVCHDWLTRGQQAYQDKLWTGKYYRLWNDEKRRSDVSLGNQLMAQWCARVAGLPDVLPAASVESALETVKALNMAATAYGLVNGVTPDGQRYDSKAEATETVVSIAANNDHARQVFFGENMCAAMTFIYHGQRETGLEIARRLYEAVALKSCSPWNQRCLIDADSGLPVWGDDYYSNLAIWALPMALSGGSVAEFSRGLAARIAAAGGG